MDKENRDTIIRATRGPNDVQISLAVLEDPNLSLKAKGIYCGICAAGDETPVSAGQLASMGPDGIDAVRTGIKELLAAGYVEPADTQLYLYLIRCGPYTKIGISDQPHRRLLSLDSGPEPMTLEWWTAIADKSVESDLHARYADKLVRREWFRLTGWDIFQIKGLS